MNHATRSTWIRRALAAASVAAALVAAGPMSAAEPPAESPAPANAVDQAATPAGPIVTWSSAHGRFEAPTSEAARKLVAELQSALAAAPIATARLGNEASPKIERLPSGVARARVPLRFVSLAVGRPGGSGLEVAACTQGPAPVSSGAFTAIDLAPAAPVER